MLRGTRVGQAYVAITADGSGINEEIVDAVDDAGKDIEDSGKEHGDRYGENFSEGFLSRMRGKVATRLSSALGSSDVGGRAGDTAGSSFVDRMTDKVEGLGDRIRDELSDRLASNPEQIRRGIDRAFDDDFADRLGERLGDRIVNGLTGALDRQSGAISAAIEEAVSGNGGGRRGGGKNDGLSGMIGRLFGAGSRNNFLNVFGKTMGGVVGLIEKGAGLASTFASNMSKAAEGASMMQKVMAGFGGGGGGVGILTRFVALGPAAGAAIGAVVLSMTIMASVAGALIGILTALASTIASALVGALAVAGPLLGAFTVSAGLLTAAFTSMTNAQRDYLFNAFQPFKAALTGVGQIIMTEFTRPLYDGRSAIQVWSDNLQRALLPVAGLAQATARSFSVAINTITASLSGPGFQRFFTSLGAQLPTIITRLSSALGGFLNGTAGMFAAIMPYVTRFVIYLDNAARSFSEWANSAKGQNSISDFVGRAVESLKSLWGFIKQVGGFIADVFFNPVSQNAGKSIFDSLAGAFEGFRKQFNKAARSGDLERWFTDAINFGGHLWSVIKSLGGVFIALYDSGVLAAVGGGFEALAMMFDATSMVLDPLVKALGWTLPGVLAVAITPIVTLSAALLSLGEVVEWLGGLVGIGNGSEGITKPFEDAFSLLNDMASYNPGNTSGFIGPIAPGLPGNMMGGYQLPQFELPDLISSGNTALDNTYEQYGGYMPDPKDKDKKKKKDEWANPYLDYANSIIAKAPTVAEEIRKAGRYAMKEIRDAVKEFNDMLSGLLPDLYESFSSVVSEGAQSTDVNGMIASFESVMNQAIDGYNAALENAQASAAQMLTSAQQTRDQMVASAEAAVQSAATALANAKNPKEAKAAKLALDKAERDLAYAKQRGAEIIANARSAGQKMIDDAKAAGVNIDAANDILAKQSVVTVQNVVDLLNGLDVESATMADYAVAREEIAKRIEDANQKLADAISLRDNYATQVGDGLRAFGSLMTAQAKTLNGVQQALTAGDITTNLQERLDKIKKFRETLRQLTAMGLSESAYKQIVDAGVEQGGAYAEALLSGGQGSVSEVNNLTGQIDEISTGLGNEAANFLYQAGVDAAAGLVDGLLSLSSELDAAAIQLGESIARAIKSSLGIASPSRVLRDMMDHVGDGAVQGLDAQHSKVGAAGSRLAGQIAVSPEVAAYAATQNRPPTTEDGYDSVSGNGGDRRFRDLIIHTPTEDPHAVAMETLNEVTGRL